MDDLKGELNRQLVLLALLYIQRRTSPYTPVGSLFEVDRRMGVPRDYLEFTTWYLQNTRIHHPGRQCRFQTDRGGCGFRGIAAREYPDSE